MRPIAVAVALLLVIAARALGQGLPLVGPAREAAREVLVDPTVFNPLLLAPLTAEPQVVVDAHGSDVDVAAHAGPAER